MRISYGTSTRDSTLPAAEASIWSGQKWQVTAWSRAPHFLTSIPRASSRSRASPAMMQLLQDLIRFDTTNPPGNERACLEYIQALLSEAGCQATLLGVTPERPNLITRFKGQGNAPPLLLYGHIDVVTTDKQEWEHPPFGGELIDGYIWGRGAVDMKGGIVMMLTALLRAKQENLPLPGDVILALVSDEEAGGDYGARFLVEQHPDLFADVRYAIGEFGGFSFHIGGKRFYPIMVAEKQVCHLRALVRGPGGHGSLQWRGGAMARLSRLLQQLDTHSLPAHVTPVTRQMFQTISSHLSFPGNLVLRQLLNPRLTNGVLKLLGHRGTPFDPLFHHTVNATMVQGGEKANVIPSEIVVELDGRLLPGFSPEDLIAELQGLVGPEVELEVLQYDPGPPEPDMGLFDLLSDILRLADPAGLPVPMLLPGTTDGRLFANLGIQTYGFLPMPLPADFNFSTTVHGANERIPVAALDFGSEAIYQLLRRFGEG
ncbi:MAG: M20/M25/M40 family metallo-hydrolase [Dehalococcoidia bacterium]